MREKNRGAAPAPSPLAVFKGPTFEGRGKKEGNGRKGRGKGEEKGESRGEGKLKGGMKGKEGREENEKGRKR